MLPDPFEAMKATPQWINWREEPGQPKPRKVPVDLNTRERIDPHDPAKWLPYEEVARRDPHHLGFVLTEGGPFFCVDLDNCLLPDGNTWSPQALEVVGAFPGAAVEVSHSGKGLHIWGSCPDGVPTHKSRGEGIELYSHKRFIAVTGRGATGDTGSDQTANLAAFITRFGLTSPTAPAACPVGEPTGGGLSDEEVIQKALAARASVKAMFGNGVTFRELWEGDGPALARAFPSASGDVFDQSAADQALANHLAFWTGRNPEQMERLMRQSDLERDKWDRPDYLARTIAKANQGCRQTYTTRPSGAGEPTGSPAPAGVLSTTDLANARRLVAAHGADLRFVAGLGGWLVWDGRRWQPDQTGEVSRLMKAVVTHNMVEEARALDQEAGERLWRFIAKSQSRRGIMDALKLAETEPGIPLTAGELDANPWLLNCENGTLDLGDSTLHPHRREDHITRILPVAFDPGAQAPLWERFIHRVTGGNPELAAFLQRAVGYSLTGETGEQCSFWLYGLGRNGKSVFLETVAALLGEYARRMRVDALMLHPGGSSGGPNPEVARLAGARLATATEPGEGVHLNEGLLKELTGGDTITARHLHREPFEFRPQFKLWVAGNHKPVIRGTDLGIWRRLRLIPFTVQIPEGEVDPDLPKDIAR